MFFTTVVKISKHWIWHTIIKYILRIWKEDWSKSLLVIVYQGDILLSAGKNKDEIYSALPNQYMRPYLFVKNKVW